MGDREALAAKLVELLAGIDFGRRYYGYYERVRDRGRIAGSYREGAVAALAATGLSFTYQRKEDFFSYREARDWGEVGLNVAFPLSSVELILVLKTAHGHVGGPFPQLARRVERLRDPAFTYSPASPKPPFSNADELRETVQFGVDLFQDAKRAILAYDGWGA